MSKQKELEAAFAAYKKAEAKIEEKYKDD